MDLKSENMDYSHLLLGKRVFITTGARGIGKAIAELFAKHGAVVAVGGRNKELLDNTMAQIKKYSSKANGYLVDLSENNQVEAVCEEIIEDFNGIDILVNTVGINVHKPIHECDDEFVLKLWNTNYMSALLCARKFIPGMIERGNGNIINISSIHADMTMPGFGIYASTKGAMNAMARAMALDYADNGIRVNNLSPGSILSDNVLDEINSYKKGSERDNFVKMLKSMQPMEPGKMEDVANTALFLASDMSKYITGQTILVDGGASIKAH